MERRECPKNDEVDDINPTADWSRTVALRTRRLVVVVAFVLLLRVPPKALPLSWAAELVSSGSCAPLFWLLWLTVAGVAGIHSCVGVEDHYVAGAVAAVGGSFRQQWRRWWCDDCSFSSGETAVSGGVTPPPPPRRDDEVASTIVPSLSRYRKIFSPPTVVDTRVAVVAVATAGATPRVAVAATAAAGGVVEDDVIVPTGGMVNDCLGSCC